MKNDKKANLDDQDMTWLNDADGDDFNFDDLEQFDTDGPVKKAAKMVFGASKSVGKGVLAGLKRHLDGVYGDDYSAGSVGEAIDTVSSVVGDVGSGLSEAFAEGKKAYNTSRRIALNFLPMTKKLAPKGLYDGVEGWLKQNLPELEDERTEEEKAKAAEDEQISTTLKDVFKASAKLEGQRALQAANDRQMGRLIAKQHHTESLKVWTAVNSNAKDINVFLRSTYLSYLKKDLELKYRHYFVAKDTLRYVKGMAGGFEQKLEAIKINTGLPEIIKINHNESIQRKKSNFYANKRSDFISGFGSQLSKNIKEKLTGGLKSLNQDYLPMMQGMSEMMGDMGGMMAPTKGEAIGGGLGLVANFLTPMIVSKLQDKHPKLAGIMKLLGGDAGDFLKLFKTGANSMKRWASNAGLDWLADIIPGYDKDKTTGKENKAYKDPEGAAVFDNLVHDSIVNIIPQHLERIGDSVEALGKVLGVSLDDKSKKTYNFVTGKLDTVHNIREQWEEQAYGSAEQRNMYHRQQQASMQEIYKSTHGIDPTKDITEDEGWQKLQESQDLVTKALRGIGSNLESLDYKALSRYAEGKEGTGDVEFIEKIFEENTPRTREAAKALLSLIMDKKGHISLPSKRQVEKLVNLETQRDDKAYGSIRHAAALGQDRFLGGTVGHDKATGEAQIRSAIADEKFNDKGQKGDIVREDAQGKRIRYTTAKQDKDIKYNTESYIRGNLKAANEQLDKSLFDPNSEYSFVSDFIKSGLVDKYATEENGLKNPDGSVNVEAVVDLAKSFLTEGGMFTATRMAAGAKSFMASRAVQTAGAGRAAQLSQQLQDKVNTARSAINKVVTGKEKSITVTTAEQTEATVLEFYFFKDDNKDSIIKAAIKVDPQLNTQNENGEMVGIDASKAQDLIKKDIEKHGIKKIVFADDFSTGWYPWYGVGYTEEESRSEEIRKRYGQSSKDSSSDIKIGKAAQAKFNFGGDIFSSIDENVRRIVTLLGGTAYTGEDISDTDKAKPKSIAKRSKRRRKPFKRKGSPLQSQDTSAEIIPAEGEVVEAEIVDAEVLTPEEYQAYLKEREEKAKAAANATDTSKQPKLLGYTPDTTQETTFMAPAIRSQIQAADQAAYGAFKEQVVAGIQEAINKAADKQAPLMIGMEEEDKKSGSDKKKRSWWDRFKDGVKSFFGGGKKTVKEAWDNAKSAFKGSTATQTTQQQSTPTGEGGPDVVAPPPVSTINFEGEPESLFHSDFRIFANAVLTALNNIQYVGGPSSIGGMLKNLGNTLMGGLGAAGRGVAKVGSALWAGAGTLAKGAGNLLFGNKEEGKTGLIPGALGLAGQGLTGAKNLLFGNKEEGKAGAIPTALKWGGEAITGAKNVLFGNKEKDMKGVIPTVAGWGADAVKGTGRFLFGDKEAGKKGVIPSMWEGAKNLAGKAKNKLGEWKDKIVGSGKLKDLKAKIFGGVDSKGKEHQNIIRKGINAVKKFFGIGEGPAYIDIYRKDKLDPGNPLLKAVDQIAGVFFVDGSGRVERSKDIDKPVYNGKEGDERKVLISEEDLKAGLVDVDGNPIYDPKKSLFKRLVSGAKKIISGIAKGISGIAKGLFGGFDNMFGASYKDKVIYYLDAIARHMGVDVKLDPPKLPGSKTPTGKEDEKKSTLKDKLKSKIEDIKKSLKDKGNSIKEKIKSIFSGKKKSEYTEQELAEMGYLRGPDGTWYDNNTGEAIDESQLPKKDEKQKKPGFFERLGTKFKEMKAQRAANKAADQAKKTEADNTKTLEEAGFLNSGIGEWVDPETGETLSDAEALKLAKKRAKKSTDDKPKVTPKGEVKVDVKNLTPYEAKMMQLAEKQQEALDAIQKASEKTAEETEKMNEEPDKNGTKEEEGSAEDQKRDIEEADKKREERVNKLKEAADKAKEAAERAKRKSGGGGKGGSDDGEDDDSDDGGGPKLSDQIKDKLWKAAKGTLGRKAKAMGLKALRKYGMKGAAKALGKGGVKGLLKHAGHAGLSKLGAGSATAGAGILAGAALGGGMGFAGSRSSGASKLSTAVSTGSGLVAGGATAALLTGAMTNPYTAAIAGAILAGNAMREGWNDEKTLKKTWGGKKVADYKKGATAAGNLANYATFGLLNKWGGRKYVDKYMSLTPFGHMVGGVGGQISGAGDVIGGVARLARGEDMPMNEDEITKGRAKLEADIKMGRPNAEKKLQEFEDAVQNKKWARARAVSRVEAGGWKQIGKGIKRYAKGYAAVMTFGATSQLEQTADMLFGEAEKPMDEKELEAARTKLKKMEEKKRPGAKQLAARFEEAVATEEWAVARKLVKMEDKGILGKIFGKRGSATEVIATGGLSLLYGTDQDKPLTEKEIQGFRDRCQKAIDGGSKTAQKLLDQFNDAVDMQEWRKARKLSNIKDKSIASYLQKAQTEIVKWYTGAWLFTSSDDNPMTEKEIDSYRKKLEYLKSQGDPTAAAKLEKFENAVIKQDWALARKISEIHDESYATQAVKWTYNVLIGSEDEPMTEEEIQKFIDSMQRKIELGDQAAQRRLDDFNDAVGRQQWRKARAISDTKNDGLFTSLGKTVNKAIVDTVWAATFRPFVGDQDEPLDEQEIEDFRDRMQEFIDKGDPVAKHKLAQFEDAVLDQNWKKARAIAGMKHKGWIQASVDWAANLFNDSYKEQTEKDTDEGKIAQRYRLIYDRVKEALTKPDIGWWGHHRLANLRNEMQDADLSEIDDEMLDEWADRLKDIDKSCGDLSEDSVNEFEEQRKEKEALIKQQQLLLKEIVGAQDRCGFFDWLKRIQLKKMFAEVEAIPMEELDEDELNDYDEQLRIIDPKAMSSKNLDDDMKEQVKSNLKRQTRLLANIDEVRNNASIFDFVKKAQLGKLKNEIESSLIEELDDEDFDSWDDELKDIDNMAHDSKERTPEELKKIKELAKKKRVLRGMIEESKSNAGIFEFGKKADLGKIINDMDGTLDEDLDDDVMAGWEDDYKSADENAKTVEEKEQEDKEHKQLLRDKRKLKIAIKKAIRKHKKDDVGWFGTDISAESQKLVNKLDAYDDEEFTADDYDEVKAEFEQLDAEAAATVGRTKFDENGEPVKEEAAAGSGEAQEQGDTGKSDIKTGEADSGSSDENGKLGGLIPGKKRGAATRAGKTVSAAFSAAVTGGAKKATSAWQSVKNTYAKFDPAIIFGNNNKAMSDEEIKNFRKKMNDLKESGDVNAGPKLDKFNEAVIAQNWATARQIADCPHKSLIQKLGKGIANFFMGDQDKPMEEKEIEDFRASMQRKIEMGDQACQRRLDAFNDAVLHQNWAKARELADKKADGLFAKIGKGVAAVGGAIKSFVTFFTGGDEDKPLSEEEIKEFKDRMQGLIDNGDVVAKNKLDQFEDACLDQNWKKARQIAAIEHKGIFAKAGHAIANLFNDEVAEETEKDTDEGDLAQKYRILLARVKEALGKEGLGFFDRHALANLRNDMQDTDFNDLSEEKLKDWQDRLAEIDAAAANFDSEDVDEYEQMRKEKAPLLKQQQNLLKEIVAAQERCGVFNFVTRAKLKKLFEEVESMSLEELDADLLDSYDEELRILDPKANTTKIMDEEAQEKAKNFLKRQTALLANIDEARDNCGIFEFSKKSQLGRLRNEVESAIMEETDDEDFDAWDEELKDIDPMAHDSKQRSSEELKKIKELAKKKKKLREMIEKSKADAGFFEFEKKAALGNILKDMDGTLDEDLEDDTISGWEDDYKDADENAKTVEEQEEDEKKHKELLKDKRKLKIAIKKAARAHRNDDPHWWETDIAAELQKLVNKLDSTDNDDFDEETYDEIHSEFEELDAEAAAGVDRKKEEDKKEEEEESGGGEEEESSGGGGWFGSLLGSSDKEEEESGGGGWGGDDAEASEATAMKQTGYSRYKSMHSSGYDWIRQLAHGNKESAISADANGNVTDVTSGNAFSVSAPLNRGGTLIHNHPDATPTSVTDIKSARDAGLSNLVTVRPKFDSAIVGKVAEQEAQKNSYKDIYNPSTDTYELQPGVTMKKTDIGDAVIESTKLSGASGTKTQGDFNSLFGMLKDGISNAFSPSKWFGGGEEEEQRSELDVLVDIYDRLGEVIGAISDHNAEIDGRIDGAASQAVSSMKSYADGKFERMDTSPPKPATKGPAIKINK